MQVSKRKINQQKKKKFFDLLYQTIADIKSIEEAELIFKDLFSKTELSAIVKRLGAAYLLDQGKNYREIKNHLKISSATISTIADQMNKGEGFKIALEKAKADEWAEKWSQKIKTMLSFR